VIKAMNIDGKILNIGEVGGSGMKNNMIALIM
jgi:hypothetical protein